MKNGTPFDRLRLVDHDGQQIEHGDKEDSAVAASSGSEDTGKSCSLLGDLMHNRVLFIAVSVACAAGAVAAGSYAIWLSRKRITQEAIMDVHDLLETCNERMRQMEHDLANLPTWKQSPKSA